MKTIWCWKCQENVIESEPKRFGDGWVVLCKCGNVLYNGNTKPKKGEK